MKPCYRYIAVEGNIGAGKTSLTDYFKASYPAYQVIYEAFEENIFLPKFYKEPEKYALALELSFLTARYEQLTKQFKNKLNRLTIADYFIDKSYIFAQKTLNDDEFKLYAQLFHILKQQLPKPDIILFLYSDTQRLLNNIKKRGRHYEQEIPSEYLNKITDSYMNYLNSYDKTPVLFINCQNLDFVSNPKIAEKIVGLTCHEYSNGLTKITI